MKNYTKTKIEPGSLAFYDIWPGNVAGLFLQPRNPHGAQSYQDNKNGFNDSDKSPAQNCDPGCVLN